MLDPVQRFPSIATLILIAGIAATAVAQDRDADGVTDDLDICSNTPAGVAVDYWGRPYADFDQDCDVDYDDLSFFIIQFTGVMPTPDSIGGEGDADQDGVPDDRDLCDNTPPGFIVDYWGRPYADFFHDCDVDLREFSFFQDQFTGVLEGCAEGQPCDDGIACTVNDTCIGNACVGQPADSLCDDGAFCNGAEFCNAQLGCQPAFPIDCSVLNGPCTVGVCDETADQCVAQPKNNGTTCSDGEFCTVGDACLDGVCVPSGDRDCSILTSACAVGVCNEAINACIADPVDNGEPCDDGEFCTTNDACLDGICVGAGEIECGYLDNQCGSGFCDEDAGTCGFDALPNGFACNDGSVCTVGDSCQFGECAGAALPDQTLCDDGNPDTDRSRCVSGLCLETVLYAPGNTIAYGCPPAGIAFTVSSFEFADDGETLTVFGAPVPMTGPGDIQPNGSFAVEGTEADGACAVTYYLNAQFNGANWVGTFGVRLTGCGACPWQSWGNLVGFEQ